MIVEFPLPTVDADFYKSQICQLPPIFGSTTIIIPQLVEPTSFLTKMDNSIASSLRTNCLENAVKRAAIRQRNLVKNVAPRPKTFTVGVLSSALASFVVTQ